MNNAPSRLLRPITIATLYLSFISGISPLHNVMSGVEHFPYGILLIVFMNRYPLWPLLLSMSLILFYTVSLLNYANIGVSTSAAYLIQSLNFIAPLFYLRGNEVLFGRVAMRVFWLYIFVGLLQLTPILKPFEPFFELFISRFSSGTSDAFRGVAMLETEPARAGFQLLILFIIATQWSRRNVTLMTIVLLLAQVIMVRSTTGILLTALYIGVTVWPKIISSPRIAIAAFASSAVVIGFALRQPKIALIINYFQLEGLQGAFRALAAISGGRFLGTYTTIIDIISWPFGHGANPEFFAQVKEVLTDQFQVEGYQTRISNRPVSAILNFIYVYGFVFLIPLWLSLRKSVGRLQLSAQSVAVLLIGLLYTPPASELWILAFAACSSRRPALTMSEIPYDNKILPSLSPRVDLQTK